MKHSTNISKLKNQIEDNVTTNNEIVCDLCNHLIQEATKLDDKESIAFAYIWKANYYFYVEPDQKKLFEYLTEVGNYIDEKHASKLLEKYYALFRLYHHSSTDYKTSLAYALKGLKTAEMLHDKPRISAYYGIIGDVYFDYECYSQALYHFHEALNTLDHNDANNVDILCLMLVSIFDCLVNSNKFEDAKQTLDYLSNIKFEQAKLEIYIDRCSMIYHSFLKDENKTNMYAQKLLNEQALEFDVLSNLYDSLMRINNPIGANKALDTLREITSEHAYHKLLKIATFQINYNVRYSPDKLAKSYRAYYDCYNKAEYYLEQIRIDSLHAKLILHEKLFEQIKLNETTGSMEDETTLDGVTKLRNRRYMNSQLFSILHNKTNKNIGLMIIDIDFFKEYNATYGYEKGDVILQDVACVLQNHRSSNMNVCRYDKDQFVCVCENSGFDEMRFYIQEIQSSLFRLNLEHSHSFCSVRVTLSIGYGIHDLPMTTHIFSFFEDVNRALYQAKENGRNSAVVVHDESEEIDYEKK